MTEYLFVGGPLDGERHGVHKSTNRVILLDEFGDVVFYYPDFYHIQHCRMNESSFGINAFVVDGHGEEFAHRLGLLANQPAFADLLIPI